MKIISALFIAIITAAAPSIATGQETALVIPHDQLLKFGYNQNKLIGLCTISMGAKEIEVWQSSIGPGDHTPRHKHNCEEIFIFVKGEGKVNIGDEDVYFKAPCTVIVPADIDHEVFNLGDEPTQHYTILRIGSTIWDINNVPMNLPWRK